VPDSTNLDELAAYLLDTYAKGSYSWATFDSPGDHPNQVRLLTGPGIPIGFVSDQTDSHEEVVSKEPALDSNR
jgi:hypothetical protein